MKRPFVVLTSLLVAIAFATPAVAHEAGQWIVRGGVGTVMPKDDNLFIGDIDFVIDLVDPPIALDLTLANSTVQVDNGTSLTLSFTYMFSENWAFDVLAAWPFKHDVSIDATLIDNDTGESGPVSLPFGEVEHLPPTFSVQYHFSPQAEFQPYVGVGLNYTTFLSEDLAPFWSELVDGEPYGILGYSLDDSFGVAAQIGADWMLNDQWLVNFDARWISIESDLTVTADFGFGVESAEIGTVKIDPWVFAINLGYRF